MQELVPLLVTVLILALLFGFITFVANVQPAKVLVHAAARNCARAGVETLSQGRGLNQAKITAVETAGSSQDMGFDPTGLGVQAYTCSQVDWPDNCGWDTMTDNWDRGLVFVCEAGYNVKVDHIPLVYLFYPKGYVPLRAKVGLTIEPYKSRWGEGEE